MRQEYITILSLVVIVLISYVSTKITINEKLKKFVPLGVDFASKLEDKTNKEKLVKAISFIEVSLLSVTPSVIRPIVDYLIDSEKIASYIERYITTKKINADKDSNEK